MAGENRQKERPWAREERDAAARVAGTAAVAGMATGIAGLAAPSKNTRKSASSARRSAARNGSKSAGTDARIAETAPAKARSEERLANTVLFQNHPFLVTVERTGRRTETRKGPGPTKGPRP